MRTYYIDIAILAGWEPLASSFRTRIPEFQVLRLIKRLLDAGEKVCILSTRKNAEADLEKSDWLCYWGLKNLPCFFSREKEKYLFAKKEETSILLDIFSDSLSRWESHGNVGVQYQRGTHETWNGYSISSDMSIDEMAAVLLSIL